MSETNLTSTRIVIDHPAVLLACAEDDPERACCAKLDALGVDPHAPDVPKDDPRHAQVQAIVSAYNIATGRIIPVPPGWEGHPPHRAIRDLRMLADWLRRDWNLVRAREMGGSYLDSTLEEAAMAVRNGFRLLDWLGVEDRPDRPPTARTLDIAKQQIADLVGWVRQKGKEGWKPPAKTETPSCARQRRHLDDDELDLRIKKYLKQCPEAKIKQMSQALDVSTGKMSGMPAWRYEMARRKTENPRPKVKERPLPKKMLEVKGVEDDPAAKLIRDEAVWRWLMETSSAEERGRMHKYKDREKADLIEISFEKYREETRGRLSDDPDDGA